MTLSRPTASASIEREIIGWPEAPSNQAYFGLAGDVVRAIEPHSEADPVAILAQLLVAFGSVVGRTAHYEVDGTRHYVNENVLVVAPTGSGRKGTSWNRVRWILDGADRAWSRGRILSGLSSGEGLIHAVRDRLPSAGEGETSDREPAGEVETSDREPLDKRLLIVEAEFGASLKNMRRDGNTLSEIVRQAWDSGDLGVLTRREPLKATGAHISIIGHITPADLRRHLDRVDVANGLANRFMLIAARRSKYLPEGGTISTDEAEHFAQRIREVVKFARTAGRMNRSDRARDLWRDVYPALADRPGGLLGAATSRAASHVVRLSCIYALLDCSIVICRRHLEAALELWRYVEASTRFFLGDSIGDPIAEAVLSELGLRGGTGLTRSEIHRLGSGHWEVADIDAALQRLANDGIVHSIKRSTGGRPSESWISARSSSATSAQSEKEAIKATEAREHWTNSSLSSLSSHDTVVAPMAPDATSADRLEAAS
jgi:hypothetical protein